MIRFTLVLGLIGAAMFAAQPPNSRPAPRPAAVAIAQRASAPRVLVAQTPGASARGYLGIGVAEITPESAKQLKLPEVRGVEITRVEDDSPAAKAGLKPADVVLEYNGQRVEGTEQLTRMVRETPPGREAKLTIGRNGVTQTVTVTTAQASQPPVIVSRGNLERQFQDMERRLREFHMPDIPEPFMSWRSSMLGVEAEALTSQLADFFGVTKGVLVRSVNRGSPAEKAGIKAGDVIVKVDGLEVSTPSQLSSRLRQLRQKQTFPITVVRNRQETTISVTLDDPAPRGRRIRSSQPPVMVRPLIRARPDFLAWV